MLLTKSEHLGLFLLRHQKFCTQLFFIYILSDSGAPAIDRNQASEVMRIAARIPGTLRNHGQFLTITVNIKKNIRPEGYA